MTRLFQFLPDFKPFCTPPATTTENYLTLPEKSPNHATRTVKQRPDYAETRTPSVKNKTDADPSKLARQAEA